jgi:hypothetical protein
MKAQLRCCLGTRRCRLDFDDGLGILRIEGLCVETQLGTERYLKENINMKHFAHKKNNVAEPLIQTLHNQSPAESLSVSCT